MNILITNDDGWGAPGIVNLAQVAAEFGQVWIVAPDRAVSGISHQLTFDRPLQLLSKDEHDCNFSLSGTPADCVRVGLTQLGVDFDWVLSGINYGGNLGADIPVSGTVAAVREAALLGYPGIAVSQYLNGFYDEFSWSLSVELTARVLLKLLPEKPQPQHWYNVNLPDSVEQPATDIQLVETFADPSPLPSRYKKLDNDQYLYCGTYQDRARAAGSDVDVCFSGNVAISLMRVF